MVTVKNRDEFAVWARAVVQQINVEFFLGPVEVKRSKNRGLNDV